jgi:hypothetical protein
VVRVNVITIVMMVATKEPMRVVIAKMAVILISVKDGAVVMVNMVIVVTTDPAHKPVIVLTPMYKLKPQ